MKATCFVGFFGITRGLNWTIESIEKNIFAPLDRAGVKQIRAAHFNLPERLDAPRSGERDVPFQMGDIGRLKLDVRIIEPQSLGNIAAPLDIVMNVPFLNEDDAAGATRRNALHQLYSLSRLGQLLAQANPDAFDMVILLRPDLRYLDSFPIRQFRAQLRRREPPGWPFGWPRIGGAIDHLRRHGHGRADIIIPSWQPWGGLNDRFAIGTPKAAAIYLNRIENLAAFCAVRSYFHPESLLDFTMRRAGFSTAGTWVRAQRVRTDGSIAALDHPLQQAERASVIKHAARQFMQI